MEIRNLSSILEGKLKPHFKIKDYSVKPLTKTGDNYGSDINAVTVNLINDEIFEVEQLEIVTKELPKSDEFRQLFQVNRTFIKESSMYTIVVPLLLAFQREKGVPEDQILDSFVECIASRKSLDPKKDTVDDGAMLVLKNINYLGFKTGDRIQGLNLEHSEFILKTLAKFHAVLIAFRKEKPEEFTSKILPFLNKLDIDYGVAPQELSKMIEILHNELASVTEIVPLMDRLKRQLEICRKRQADLSLYEESPFNSFCHNDFWVNNIMISHNEGDTQPKSVKMIDFQFIQFGSVVHDVLFFIFNSVENKVIEEEHKIDHLLEVYYETFVEALKLNGCPLGEFSKESFLEEINSKAIYELYHILSMTKVLLVDKEKMHAMDDLSFEDYNNPELVGSNYYHKLKVIVLEFNKRGWLIE